MSDGTLWNLRSQRHSIVSSELRKCLGSQDLYLLDEHDLELRKLYSRGRKDSQMYLQGIIEVAARNDENSRSRLWSFASNAAASEVPVNHDRSYAFQKVGIGN